MSCRRQQCAVVIAAFALLCTGACGDSSAPEAGEPLPDGANLLLITIDTLRADRLGVYGNDAIETPAIDRLAAEGVRFARALTASPTTLPSHASIFTGATPPRHGLRDNAAGVLPPAAATMAEAFAARGYRTGAFVSAFVLDARWGLSQGFEVYNGPPVAPGEAPASAEQAERRGDEAVEAALGWIAEQRDGRWFAWVHLFDPHAPYAAPEPFRSKYAERPYDGEVAYTDSLVGEIRARLEQLDVWSDTTVVLTSDHGEALREHGEPAHGFFLYEPTLRVPLIIRPAAGGVVDGADPGAANATDPPDTRRGAVVTTPVALIDIFPTVAELWGLDAGAVHEGRSLAPALRGAALDVVPVYSETLLPRLYFGWHDLRALNVGDDKFIEAPRPELYDLSSDIGETVNLAADRPARVDELRRALEEWVGRSESATFAGGSDGTDGDVIDTERLAALRALGYLGVGGGDGGDLADPKDKIEVYAAMMAALGASQAGEIDAAVAIIDEQIAADPGFAGALHFRGVVLAGAGRFAEAAAAFRAALDVDPSHPLAGRELARAHRALGDLDAAADVLSESLAAAPGDADLRWELVDVYLRAGTRDAARQTLQDGLRLDADAPKMHFGAGIVALQEGGVAEALAAFDRAAVTAPYLPDLEYRRGEALERLGRNDEALAAYESEVARQPRHYFALFGRARLLAAAGAPLDRVVAALRDTLAVRPAAPEAALFLAQVLVDRGDASDLDEAERLAVVGLRGVRVPQLAAMGHATLAQIYEAQGRAEDAERERAAAARAARGG